MSLTVGTIEVQKTLTRQDLHYQNGKIMKKQSQHSNVLDFLMRNLYDVDLKTYKTKDHVDPKSAKSLYSVWKDTNNQVSAKIYKKPETLSSSEIEAMTNQGLIRCVGDKVEITSKGSDIIKTMILGNDKSFFDGNNDQVEILPDTGIFQHDIGQAGGRSHRDFLHLNIVVVIAESQVQKVGDRRPENPLRHGSRPDFIR